MKSEAELKLYSDEVSETIVYRSFQNGNSYDTERAATKLETAILTAVIFGALLSIRNGSDIQCAADTAEFIGKNLLPSMNGYDSIYLKIKKYSDENIVSVEKN